MNPGRATSSNRRRPFFVVEVSQLRATDLCSRAPSGRVGFEEPSCFGLHDCNDVCRGDVDVVLSLFFVGELSFVGLFCELINALLKLGIGTKVNELPSRVRGEAAADGFKDAIEK